jgi:hypothetical protein
VVKFKAGKEMRELVLRLTPEEGHPPEGSPNTGDTGGESSNPGTPPMTM